MRDKSIRKAIVSYDRLIREHLNKIKKEKTKKEKNPERIDYWEKEIKTFKENRRKLIS